MGGKTVGTEHVQKPGEDPKASPLGGVLLMQIVQALGSTHLRDPVRMGLEQVVERTGEQ